MRASIRSFRKVVIDHSPDFGTDKKALLGKAKEALERMTLKITKCQSVRARRLGTFSSRIPQLPQFDRVPRGVKGLITQLADH